MEAGYDKNARTTLRVFAQSPADFFEAGFREIEARRMKGLPILNPKLHVKAVRFRRWQNDWFGTLVTPWAILAVYACGARGGWADVPSGKTRFIELPAGDFPFVAIEDDVLGRYLALSLKSPVQDVGDQETAELIANFAFEEMLKAQVFPEDDEDAVAWVPPTADGQLRRVIPIKVAPPKNVEATPALTPAPPEPEKADEAREPFFERSVSRRNLFGSFGRKERNENAGTEKPTSNSALAKSSETANPADSQKEQAANPSASGAPHD